MLLSALLLAAVASPAACADESSPVMFSLLDPVQWPSSQSDVSGFRLSLLYGECADFAGFDIGLVGRATGDFRGLSIGVAYKPEEKYLGVGGKLLPTPLKPEILKQ